MPPPFNTTSLRGRADLLRAMQYDDAELLQGMAEILGFEARPKPSPKVATAPPIQTETLPPPSITEPVEPPSIPFWRVTAQETSAPLETTEDPPETTLAASKNPKKSEKPEKWARAEATQPQPVPLASWPRLLPYLRRAAMARAPGKPLDVARATRRLSQGEMLHRLPRLPRATWGQAIQILIDRSERLTPYWQDQLQILGWIRRLFPATGVEIAVYWDGMDAPLRQANGKDWHPPAPGTLVLVLGDLGQFSDNPAVQRLWLDLGRRLREAECRPVALLPTARNIRVPGWQTLAWERDHRGRTEVSWLFTLLAPAVRIEPGLLREVRQWQNGDAALESVFWQHGDLLATSSIAATLAPEKLKHYRLRFDALPVETRRKLLDILLKWRRALPFEIWIDEFLLNAGVYACCKDDPAYGQEYALAAKRLRAYAADEGKENHGVLPWFRRVSARLTTHEGLPTQLRPALDRLWNAAHRDDESAQAPQGYDPAHIPSEAPLRTLQIYQQADQLRLVYADHPGASPQNHGSWLGSLATRNQQVLVEVPPPFWSGEAPAWASDWGRDGFGLWVEFKLPSPEVSNYYDYFFSPTEVTQRLRWIPAGSFVMGSPESEAGRWKDEGPQHPVTLTEGFWLFDTPVTQALWQAVMVDNPCRFQSWCHPVEQVSWDDAKAFIGKINKILPGLDLALPSEAQWEYACRAGTPTAIYAGDLEILGERNAPLLDEIAWYGGNSGQDFELENGWDSFGWAEKQYPHKNAGSHPVGLKKPNPWGLYDMLGNVLEWCEDYWDDYYPEAAQTDPTGPMDGGSRVCRGGSWLEIARNARAAYRGYSDPDYRVSYLGFRCARVQAGAKPVQAEPLPGAESGPKASQAPEASGTGGLLQTDGASTHTLPWPRVEVFVLRTDAGALRFAAMPKPTWATDQGRDRFGLWVEFSVGAVTQRLRWIPPGRFWMGSPESEPERFDDEGPRHEVTLTQGFWLFDTTVTQALWEAVMAGNPSHFQGPDRPVEMVSWNDCQGFIDTLNQRLPGLALGLPTEAQWEYACRAGTQTPFYFGDSITPEQVNYHGNYPYNHAPKGPYRGETVAVKTLPPNPWGLYEMHGNVREWCADYWRDYYPAEAQTDPTGPESGDSRVFRGGSWVHRARSVRAAFRSHSDPGFRDDVLGFRCARVQVEPGQSGM